jgi:hypothetical protein
MTAPAFRAFATNVAVAAAVTIDKPAGTVDDDIMIAEILTVAGGITPAAPAGWTTLVARFDITDNGYSQTAFWKRASSEGANYQFTAGGASVMLGNITSWSGAITSGDPFDVVGAAQGGTGTSLTALSVTTTVVDTRVIMLGSLESSADNNQSAAPSGMTEHVDHDGSVVNSVEQAAAGATGDKTGTITSDEWIAVLVALKPPAAGGGLFSPSAGAPGRLAGPRGLAG